MNPQPKPIKRSTLKARRRLRKRTNIGTVYERVFDREDERCRIGRLMERFGFDALWDRLELAHIDARGMGGNPSLSRDTTQNTIIATRLLHQGPYSLHSGYLKVRPLTEKGADGPCCFEFYEALPTQLGMMR